MYKRMVLLLRSLFSVLRVLPAHTLYRQAAKAKDKEEPVPFSLFYSMSAEPKAVFSSLPSNLVFAPIDTPSGRLHLSVFYRPNCDFGFETSSRIPSAVIQDYVDFPSET